MRKNQKIENYFPLPNEIFSLGLNGAEIAIYAYLLRCEDRQTYSCHPSYKTIGRAVCMSENTVKKHVELLVNKGLIKTERTRIFVNGKGWRNGNLLYRILPIGISVEKNMQKQLANAELMNTLKGEVS